MKPENSQQQKPSLNKSISRFIGGATLAAFLIFIPISYGGRIDLNLFQISIALLLAIFCGLLSTFFGQKFINAVMNSLENFSI
ncbi:MAG: hypothetical protein SAJ37_19095 [Oscillatoria sp. PMC 1068.18]|nr:hypothetical protein [Oscillatoria sp. PMC 1076.18]MEC4990844.1 hypothetical protein [Oscillatoria sp. PMC 1068.18]